MIFRHTLSGHNLFVSSLWFFSVNFTLFLKIKIFLKSNMKNLEKSIFSDFLLVQNNALKVHKNTSSYILYMQQLPCGLKDWGMVLFNLKKRLEGRYKQKLSKKSEKNPVLFKKQPQNTIKSTFEQIKIGAIGSSLHCGSNDTKYN